MRSKLDRRTLLRGVLGGAAVAVGLPALEIFLNNNGNAYAAGDPFPKRFGIWFWGNGLQPDWAPTEAGESWALSPMLEPLAPMKKNLTVVSGLKVYMPNVEPHGTGPKGLLAGARTFKGPSLDQVIGATIGADTPFRSVELSVERSASSVSHLDSKQENPSESSPAALFARLFGDFTAPSDMPKPNPKLGLRRSILDAISDDSKRLQARLGSADQKRLELHYENIRSLEKRLAYLEANPPKLAACAKPPEPLADYPDKAGRPQLEAIHRAMTDIMLMALACDQTRVFTLMFCNRLSGLLFFDYDKGYHQLTHDEPEPQPLVRAIQKLILTEFNYFLEKMASIQEGDGTLLDHSIIMGTTDCVQGKSHAIDNYPVLLAGSGGGVLKQGIHYRSTSAENASKLGFSLQRMLGIPVTSYGADEGLVSEGLNAIEVG